VNDQQLATALRAVHTDSSRYPDAESVVQDVVSIPFHQIPQQRGFVPILTGRFQSMFNATKFAAAGVLVALFGGFLLAGILSTPQGEDAAPAVVTKSPAPTTTEALLSSMVTEEVEPGVFWVVNDGVRDLSYPVGYIPVHMVDVTPDGSVWLSGVWPSGDSELSVDEGGHGLFRLGEEPVFEDPKAFPPYREVAPDGSLWGVGQVSDDRRGIFSFDGEGWTVRATTTDSFSVLAVGPDGTVWVLDADKDKHCPDIEDDDCSGTVLLRLEDDGSLTTIEDWGDVYVVPTFDDQVSFDPGDASTSQLAVSPGGDVWLVGTQPVDPDRPDLLLRFDGEGWTQRVYSQRPVLLLRFDGEGWEAIPGPEGWAPGEQGRWLDVGPDGTLWVKANPRGGLARFDDPGWTTFTQVDGLKPWGEGDSSHADQLTVAADGSLWLAGSPLDEDACGVTHFDGTTATSYLVGTCIEDLAIALDGSVWLRADARSGDVHVYVITPEAVAASE